MARSITGLVTSDKGDKTIVITLTERRTHPLYKKQYTVTTKFMAHDEKNEAKVGDRVVITECRPMSARKRFSLSKVLQKASTGFEEADATADIPVEEKTEVPKPAVKKKAAEEPSKEEAK